MVVVLVYAWIASHTLVQMQFPEPNSSEAQVEPRLASPPKIQLALDGEGGMFLSLYQYGM